MEAFRVIIQLSRMGSFMASSCLVLLFSLSHFGPGGGDKVLDRPVLARGCYILRYLTDPIMIKLRWMEQFWGTFLGNDFGERF